MNRKIRRDLTAKTILLAIIVTASWLGVGAIKGAANRANTPEHEEYWDEHGDYHIKGHSYSWMKEDGVGEVDCKFASAAPLARFVSAEVIEGALKKGSRLTMDELCRTLQRTSVADAFK